MSKKKLSSTTSQRWNIKTVLITILITFIVHIVIDQGPDIVRSIMNGKVPAFLSDARDGFMDGYHGRPPRY